MHRNPFTRYYVPGPSPWPLVVGVCCNSLCVSLVLWMHRMQAEKLFLVTFLVLGLTATLWWTDVLREGDMGVQTQYVLKSYRDGMGLFIFSEIMFFFSFFWALFHNCLSPSGNIGCEWPPLGIRTLDPMSTALFNTFLLISSGSFCTYVHNTIRKQCYDSWCLINMLLTITCGVLFLVGQGNEYFFCSFSIADSVYGSTFYMLTGFHGGHVMVGTTWLIVSFFRMWRGHFSKDRHFGLEACLWYWHFVDVVWLFVWLIAYFWLGGMFSDKFGLSVSASMLSCSTS
nr:cytochrome c oxidase subunit III [Perna perna]UVH65898.1 cytochrome c oxidase subunit III [Perna perna]WRV01109.1 cytochrome c oxidase subunit III [Perna perna]